MTSASSGSPIDQIVDYYREHLPQINIHLDHVIDVLKRDPVLVELRPLLTSRVKDPERLADKVRTKRDPENREITPESLLQNIEDLAGARMILHHRADVTTATARLEHLAEAGEWSIVDRQFYPPFGREADARKDPTVRRWSEVTERPGYSSRHFILAPKSAATDVRCELQVRTVLEEAIYENQRRLVYGRPDASVHVTEVMRFLSELCAAGDALLERCYEWTPAATDPD